MLQNPFYYGTFEYPKESSNWYQGKHQPIIDQSLFDKVQEQLKRDHIVRESKEFAFTKMIVCGLCGSGITAEEKYKKLRDGTTRKYTYYGCTRSRDRQCKNKYIQEEELIKQLLPVIDKVDINELGMKHKLDEEIRRFNKFQNTVMGNSDKQKSPDDVDVRTYAKYLLKEGSIIEKRELLANLKGRMVYTDRKISLII